MLSLSPIDKLFWSKKIIRDENLKNFQQQVEPKYLPISTPANNVQQPCFKFELSKLKQRNKTRALKTPELV